MQFTVTDQQADQILNALAQRPYIEAAPLINELMKQVQAQKQGPQTGTAIAGDVVGAASALNGAGAAALPQ